MIDYRLFPFITTLMSLLLLMGIVFLSQNLKRPGAVNLFLLFASILGWLIFNTLELVDPTEFGTLLWGKVTYIFIFSSPVLWLFFILDYYGYKRFLRYPTVFLFWLIPAIGLALVFTNDYHHYFWSSYTFLPVGDYLAFQVKHGPAFYVFWGYAYLLILAGLALLARESYRGPKLYQWRSGWIALGGLIVVFFNLLYVSKIIPAWQKDYTPVALAISVLCFITAISKFQLFKVIPIRKTVLFEALDDGVIVVDRDNIVLNVNLAAQKLFGITEDGAVGNEIDAVLPSVPEIVAIVNHPGEGWQDISLPSSPVRHFSIKSSAIQDALRHVWGNMLLVRDTTREKQTQLAEKEERLFALALSEIAAALNSTRNLDELLDLIIKNVVRVTACDSANIMMIENDYAHAVRSLEPLKNWRRLPVGETPNLKWMMENRKPIVMPDVNDFPEWIKIPEMDWIRSYVGAPIITMDSVTGFINLDLDTPGFYNQKTAERLMSFAYHVSIAIQNAHIYKQLEELATTDELTGIDNRRQFFDLAVREVDRAQRYQRPLTAIMLDVDHFKKINDRYGHLAGDFVLRRVAQTCLSETRGMDVLGRVGGEEFALLLTETDLSGGIEVAERIREKISLLNFKFAEVTCRVTASLGIAALDETCTQLTDLLDRCDKAMYLAKKQGRNRVAAG